jgi:hypothetical protein
MMAKTLKALEIAISGMSEAEWDKAAQEVAIIRAKIRAQYALENIIQTELDDVALGALYHAGKLFIGCENKPVEIIYYSNRGVDREIWGMKVSSLDSQANKAFSIGDW